MKYKTLLTNLCLLLFLFSFSQNETKKWLFGVNGGLDFMTNPPTSFINPINTVEGCSSVADAGGNLLFYSNGATVWNQSYAVMANGSALAGDWSATQSSIIIKQPGSSTLYILFTLGQMGGNLSYSIIDMSLAAGMGSVTTKNVLLHTPSAEKLTGVKHCNGTDFWVISHDVPGITFRSYLVTSAGVNTVAVTSSAGSYNTNNCIGQLKASPGGTRLGAAYATSPGLQGFELYDFDNSTGIVSNAIFLGNVTGFPYGCEFSADGTKFYGCIQATSKIYQWDLCAANVTSTISSLFTNALSSMQLASDGKIYVSRGSSQNVGVINNPNTAGAGCNYSDLGPYLVPSTMSTPGCQLGLPNFVTSYFKKSPPFTYTTSCQTVSFTAPAQLCSVSGPSFTSVAWDFGDPGSGTSNLSNILNPVHTYTGSGTYNTKLILYYPCSVDTVKLPVAITSPAPLLTVTGQMSLCKGQSRTYTVSGANTYSWNTGSTGSVTVVSPTFSTIYTVSGTDTTTKCSITKTFTVVVFPCTGIGEINTVESNILLIYPNPGKDNITIETEKNCRITIYNQLGSIVLEQTVPGGKNQIDISRLTKGVYMIKSSEGPGERICRLVKTD